MTRCPEWRYEDRKHARFNGLAVLCRSCSGQPISYDPEAAIRDQIIGGPGAFVVTAGNAETVAGAVRRNLFLEIATELPLQPLAITDDE